MSQSVGGEADSFPFDSLRVRDDSQKSESNNNGSSRFPEGMTERKATATTHARATANLVGVEFAGYPLF